MPKLIITAGPDAGRELRLAQGTEVSVGRGDGNVLQLTDLTVSRYHFCIVEDGGAWKLRDEGSRNLTVVNEAPVQVHALGDGDRVAVGATEIMFVDDAAAREAPDVLPDGFEHVTMEIAGLTERVRGAERLGQLYRFAEVISGAERLDALYEAIVREGRQATRADRGFLFIHDQSGELVTASQDGEGDARVAVSRTIVDKVLQESKSVLASDAWSDARFSGQTSIVNNRIRSVMCAPVVSRGRAIGILYTDIRREDRAFGSDELPFLTALAQQAGIAIENLTLRDALVAENAQLRQEIAPRRDLIGESAAMQTVLEFIRRVAPTDSTVMLNGESGAGKELVARAVHRHSHRRERPFIAVNCAALTESLLESELFGHEKGAFTGATGQKKGRFELADGGTLFLDEVGELNLNCQTKFLRVLEESRFERVGGGRSIGVDVRVVAATNRNLQKMVKDGQFRADLFYRLQVIQIELPPLRRREGDVPLLVRHFVRRYAEKIGRRVDGVTPEAMDALNRHRWPGNIRELKNAIERAMVLGEGPLLRVEDLPPSITGGELHATSKAMPALQAVTTLKEAERRAIVAALRHTDGNKARAAQLLECDRSTLYKKIRDYDIEA
jgi:Nif-specific regulatory protein